MEVLMTPNEIGHYLYHELLVVPVAWSYSNLALGDTPFTLIFRVVFAFTISTLLCYAIIQNIIMRPNTV